MPDVICAFVFQGGQQSLAAPHDPRVQRERGAALQGGDAVETVGFLVSLSSLFWPDFAVLFFGEVVQRLLLSPGVVRLR